MLIVIANSIASTKINGNAIDLNVIKMITKIAKIDNTFTTLKSSLVVVIKSFDNIPSPVISAFLSY